jgi:hypothetical protein
LKGRQQRLAQRPCAEKQSDKLPWSEKPHSEKLQSIGQQLSVSWRSAGLQRKRRLRVKLKDSVGLQHLSGQSLSSALQQWNTRSVSAVLQH